MKSDINKKLISERKKLLTNIERATEVPLAILGFVWLGLLIIELLNKTTRLLETAGVIIWLIFIVDFIIKFFLSPLKINFLRKNILTLISLVIPAFRIFRLLRVIRLLRLGRGIRLIKVVGSLNRGMRSLALAMHRRAVGYVLAFSVLVMFVGGAAIHAFEGSVNENFNSYGTSLWRTAMLIMSMGTDWPITTEGRILYFMVALYGLAVFGYVTATLATFFIGRDAENRSTEIAGSKQIEELKKEILSLRQEIKKLNNS